MIGAADLSLLDNVQRLNIQKSVASGKLTVKEALALVQTFIDVEKASLSASPGAIPAGQPLLGRPVSMVSGDTSGASRSHSLPISSCPTAGSSRRSSLAVAPLPDVQDAESSPAKEAAKDLGKEAPKGGKRTSSFSLFKKKDSSKSSLAPLVDGQLEPASPASADGLVDLCVRYI